MKIVVGIIIYNRLHNLKHWIECLEKCDRYDAEFVLIHNWDGSADNEYSKLCKENSITYIKRKNIGYDIGAFQDVCRNRLQGFPEWDRLLWIVDDCMPMSFNFIEQFNLAMKKGVGVACMYISPYVRRHIRTTGFMLDRSTAEQLTFPADPIVTKEQCFQFEHRKKGKIFYDQVIAMGLKVEMVANNRTSPLWDSGYHRRVDREKEHQRTFGEVNRNDKILFICPIYKTYPQIISSLLLQTHKNWVLMLIHDGPDTDNVARFVPDDDRIAFMETPKHGGYWGHYIRQVGIEVFKDFADFLVVTNPDNYHAPVFCEYLLKGFGERDSAVAVYCSQIVHSYTAWNTMDVRLQRGFIDIAGIMIKSKEAAEVGWKNINDHSADWEFISDLITKFGKERFHKVKCNLVTHN
jgi:hypothetical protein